MPICFTCSEDSAGVTPETLEAALTPEPFRFIGDPGEPELLPGWSDNVVIGGGTIPSPPLAFYKDPLGRCHIVGGLNGTPGSPNPFATPAFILPEFYIPETTVVMDAANSDLVSGTGVAIVFVMGLDAPVFATPGGVVPVFADFENTFLDGSFRVAS